jgi:GTP-binding protein
MSLVAIVGRPNVGKSTLFNRLVGGRHAIVDKTAGVTRDRIYGKCEWCGKEFSVVDTGGFVSDDSDVFEPEIRKQVLIAIDECDLILFMVEAGAGITTSDAEIAQILRKAKKPVVLVCNKVDTSEKSFDSYDFYSLGLGDPFCISSANGSGTGDMLDEILRKLPQEKISAEDHPGVPKIAIVGKPNVGKSSLTNALLGEDRNIVTPVAGTTRDAISSYYNQYGHEFMLIDTAGLRRKAKVNEDLEFYSVMRSIRAIENSDICILMIDVTTGIEAQDMAIFNLIIKNKKGLVVVVNKWDTVVKDSNSVRDYTQSILAKFAPFNDIPLVFASATKKQRILDVMDTAEKVWANYSTKIPTSKLNDAMLPEIENYPPPAWKGKYLKIKFITQLPTPSPSFAFFCNLPQYFRDPYKRFLENKLREHFTLTGCTVTIYMRQK